MNETDRIEADLSESRHRLNDTLERLGNKLSPGQILDEALGVAKGQAGHFTANLGRQVRDNPLPAVLIAAGIALYLTKQSQPAHGARWSADDWRHDRQFRELEEARWRTQRLATDTEETFSERVHDAQAQALGLMRDAGESVEAFKSRAAAAFHAVEQKAAHARGRISQALGDAGEAVRDGKDMLVSKAGDAKRSAQGLYDDNPLAGGAVALAIGAIIGSLAPLTNAERDTLSDVADGAARAGADIAEKGAQAVGRAVDSVH